MEIRVIISLICVCLVGWSWGIPVIDYPETEIRRRSNCILTDVIHEFEGMETEGYVPRKNDGSIFGHSGVTIAGGVDLGSKTRSYFSNIGVCDSLIDKLEPYFGYKKWAAVRKLRRDPLTLTDDEATYLTKLVMQENVESVESMYNEDIDSDKLRFDQLTDAQKTVIASVKFQYGTPSRKTPTFWRHVTNQDWDAAIGELRDFGDDYEDRRNSEADLLEDDDGSRGQCDTETTDLECP